MRWGDGSHKPSPLLNDLPVAVGLLAGFAEALLLLTANCDGLLEFTAIGAAVVIAVSDGNNRAGIAVIGVVPGDLLTDGGAVGAAFGLLILHFVGGIHRRANFIACPATEHNTKAGHRQIAAAFTELAAQKAACRCAAQGANSLIRAPIAGLTARQHQRCRE